MAPFSVFSTGREAKFLVHGGSSPNTTRKLVYLFRGKLVVRASLLQLNVALVRCGWVS